MGCGGLCGGSCSGGACAVRKPAAVMPAYGLSPDAYALRMRRAAVMGRDIRPDIRPDTRRDIRDIRASGEVNPYAEMSYQGAKQLTGIAQDYFASQERVAENRSELDVQRERDAAAAEQARIAAQRDVALADQNKDNQPAPAPGLVATVQAWPTWGKVAAGVGAAALIGGATYGIVRMASGRRRR